SRPPRPGTGENSAPGRVRGAGPRPGPAGPGPRHKPARRTRGGLPPSRGGGRCGRWLLHQLSARSRRTPGRGRRVASPRTGGKAPADSPPAGAFFGEPLGRVVPPTRLEFEAEPAAGVSPVIVGRGGGNAQGLRGLRDGQAGEEAQLDEFGLALVLLFQL